MGKMPWGSLILGVMRQFFLAIAHIVRHIRCSTIEPYVCEESVHVLFDESNSLVENDAQDEDFELGLAKKDLLSTHEKVRIPKKDQGLNLFLRKESKVTNK